MAWLILSLDVFAGDTVRVVQQLLPMGDTAVHAIDLLGTPAYKDKAAAIGDQGQKHHG